MGQRYHVDPNTETVWPNGAIGYAPGGPNDPIGPYAKVKNCPIKGTALRLTCYATGEPLHAFAIPACTRFRGKHVKGVFQADEDGVVFVPYKSIVSEFFY